MNKMISKKNYLLFTLFFPVLCQAQFSVSVGYNHWKPVNKSFTEFRKSYNDRGANTLTKQLGEFKASQGLRYDVGYGFGIFDIRFGVSPINTSTSAMFKNGESRTFQMKATMLEGSFGFRLPSDKWYVGFYVGFEQNTERNSRIFSYYTYKDGTKSYTNEKFISDAFRDNFTTISFAVRGATGLRKIKLFGSIEKFGQMGSPSHTELKDDLNRWSITGPRFMTNYLLSDYHLANNDINASSGDADNVLKTFNGWRFSVGLEAWPIRKKEK